ncbi:hypothetical protein TRVA0_038S01046 [Trichomonascus vanleenenianus]|uniref:uncharacterized protein n=1 Tax=Trichomonascus vanleenenianus TaxID=2268995 RepID=UPI003ECB462D
MVNQIITALQHCLPDEAPEIVYASDLTYRKTHIPDWPTTDHKIPAFVKVPAETFKPIFDKLLAKLRESESPIVKSRMPEAGTNWMQREADVTKVVYKLLLHPVDIALQDVVTQLGSNDKIYGIPQYQTKTEPICRFDYAWVLHSGNSERIVAVLELKNTRVLHEQDFAPGQCPTQPDFGRKMEEAMGTLHGTLLKDNAYALSLQVSKYSEYCKSIALFDWNAMVLFNFNREKEDMEGIVRGTFFRENKRDKKVMTFRGLLFTFVAQSLERCYVDSPS